MSQEKLYEAKATIAAQEAKKKAEPLPRLDRDKILAQQDVKRVSVNVPEWGGSVLVWSMTAAERDAFEAQHATMKHLNARARLVVACVRDEEGTPMFTAKDIDALSSRNCRAMNRIFKVGMRLNGFDRDDLPELEKNSD